MDFNPHATELIFRTPFPANKSSFFIHSTKPYIHHRLDSRIELKFSDWCPNIKIRCCYSPPLFYVIFCRQKVIPKVVDQKYLRAMDSH